MLKANSCPRCHAEMAADTPLGLCPQCLIERVVQDPGEADEAGARRTPISAFVPPAPAVLSRHFPQLEVLALLGQGGMGAVYKARQRKLDRLVAVKILPSEVASDPTFAERFMREAQALARLNHPNIVTIYDFGDVDGLYYFTMEYVDGRGLRERLESGELTPGQVLPIMAQLCEALQYAHDEGFVHRDIKPENILLDKKGRVKVADFGLAKLVGLTPAQLTLTGTHEVMGTLLYMAPEQMRRSHTVDHRADIYSLGVVLYEMLTGELPLGRFAPPSRKAAVDEQVDQVVLRALAREPAERYQDAAAFKQDLERALARSGDASASADNAPPNLDGQDLASVVQWSVQLANAIKTPPKRSKSALLTVRFYIGNPNDAFQPTARGLLRCEDGFLVIEFEFAKRSVWKKFKALFEDPQAPHEIRIPLREVASIGYGWGWGRPPCSLIIKVTRLAALGGMPGSALGQVQLYIERQDRSAARRLVERIGQEAVARGMADPTGTLFDRDGVRAEVMAPASGLLATGLLTPFSWVVWLMVWVTMRDPGTMQPVATWILVIALLSSLIAVSGLLIFGALQMLRLRWYPVATATAIAAMIPWSPAWLIGLPFGIWACIVLGRPEVVEAFFVEKRQPPVLDRSPDRPLPTAGWLASFLRSVGGYMIPTMPGKKHVTPDAQEEAAGNKNGTA